MALPFIPSDAALLLVQAACVAAPRAAAGGAAPALERLRGRGWAILPLASIVGVIFAIRYVSDTATGLTWLALIAVPPLAALALGWAMRGARAPAAAGAIALFAVAWVDRSGLAGEAAATLLSALSCVTLGVLLATVTPPNWLKVGIVAMACADTWLVATDLLQGPNAALVAATPPGHLPRLQSELFGTVSMGYGDLFVAGVLGALLARDAVARQMRGAVLTLVIAAVFDLLFLVINELPATVPVALALIAEAVWWRLARPSADRRRSRPAAATPRPAR